ncbi:hypothetical protein Dimus_036086 [Dionaea muscipula]
MGDWRDGNKFYRHLGESEVVILLFCFDSIEWLLIECNFSSWCVGFVVVLSMKCVSAWSDLWEDEEVRRASTGASYWVEDSGTANGWVGTRHGRHFVVVG